MSEMIERVKAGIAKEIGSIEPDAKVSELLDEELADLARAAIEAMREPTEAMIESGHDAAYYQGWIGKPLRADIAKSFSAMIDTALQPKGEAK